MLMVLESVFIDSLIRILFSKSYFDKHLLAQTYISQYDIPKTCLKIMESQGTWVSQSVKCLPLAQVMISGAWDGATQWTPSSVGSLLLPLPLPPATHALFFSQIHK